MSFTPEQITALDAKLDASHVKQRSQSGRALSYIEGWLAIAEANRIFGFDGWTRETVECRLVAERERKIGQAGRDGWGVSYVARVKVVVFAGDTIVTREGIGAGHGIDADLGLAHESAVKEAETDAMKRALMTFGNPFGLALYDKAQEGVEPTPGRAAGGHARAAALSPARRSEIAADAARARWNGDEAAQRPAQRQEPRPVSQPAPATNGRHAADDEAPEAVRAKMFRMLADRATVVALDKLIATEGWQAGMDALDDAGRRVMAAAIEKRRGQLSNPMMAG